MCFNEGLKSFKVALTIVELIISIFARQNSIMYPDLSYIMHALIGTAQGNAFSIVKTFGFFLALVFVVSGYFFNKELKRKEEEGLLTGTEEEELIGAPAPISALIINGLVGLLIGAKIPYIIANFDEFKLDGASVLFSSKGNILTGLLGAIALAGYTYYDFNKRKLDNPKIVKKTIMPHERSLDLVIMAAVSGIIGAKVFAIIDDFDQFLLDPFGTFFSGSGMAIYGGLIGAFFFMFFYCKSKKLKAIHLMDAAAPVLLLGYAIGRLGCHFSGDGDWGIVSDFAARPGWLAAFPDWLWGFDYPNNVNNDGVPIEGCTGHYCHKLPAPVYPTSVYEAIYGVTAFLIFWGIRKKVKIVGFLFFMYLLLNGIERYLIEIVRVNDVGEYFFGIPMTQAQGIAMIFVFCGILGMLVLWWRHKSGKPILF